MKSIDKLKKFTENKIIKAQQGVRFNENAQLVDEFGNQIEFNNQNVEHIRARHEFNNSAKITGSELSDRGEIVSNLFGVSGATGHQKTIIDKDGKAKVTGLSADQEAGLGMASNIAAQAFNAIDAATMGDKNFGAQSAAIDTAVHGVSSALMKSGNPYAMAAGAALEGANFLTKAGGQTVQGFDVDIDNSGYGNLGHMDSSSSRDFGAMIGLGGLNKKSMDNKLAKRNAQAQMALQAAEISEDSKFEQEARMNSVQNTIMNNKIALSGGIDTSLLGS